MRGGVVVTRGSPGAIVTPAQVEDVYEIFLPEEVRHLLQQVRIIISLGLEGVPLECVGADGYVKRLLFCMLAPIGCILLFALARLLMQRKQMRHACRRLRPGLIFILEGILIPSVLRVGFVVYPIVSNTAFEVRAQTRTEPYYHAKSASRQMHSLVPSMRAHAAP